MSDLSYVREYFSQHAREWLGRAYGQGRYPSAYPVGVQRVRLALEAVHQRLGALRGRVVDLGCGGGELCAHAARLGFDVTGIDIAPGMIDQAERRRLALPEAVQRRLRFRTGDALTSGLATGGADAVTALGLLEYLEADGAFFEEAGRLLRPGGVLVVSCRNRLFNLASLNDYTRQEVEAGAAAALLAELRGLASEDDAVERLKEFAVRLREAGSRLEEALAEDVADAVSPAAAVPSFVSPRRQHRPGELTEVAGRAGFEAPGFFAMHPHPLPPAFEAIAPRFYNLLAIAWEPLERLPASLGWSSAFLGVFSRWAR